MSLVFFSYGDADMCWIINDKIRFIPEEKKLISLAKPELHVVLTRPASRCLELLLEASPDMVSQNDIFEKVWRDNAKTTPLNTLYQNISIIRRGLNEASETSESYITTVPRKGFRISSSINVVRESDENSGISEGEINSLYLPEAIDNTEEATREEDNALVENTATPVTLDPLPPVKKKNRRLQWALIPTGGAVLCVALYILASKMVHYSEPDFFSDYDIVREVDGCHFHSKNDDINSYGNFSKFIKIVKDSKVNCEKYPWIYFLSSRTIPTLNAVACKKPFNDEKNRDCTTLIFRGVTSD